MSRTPASSTKQFYLANLFATPTTMRYAAMVEAEDENTAPGDHSRNTATAGSPEPKPSETPSFLRRTNTGRYPPPTANNDTSGLSPIASRKPRQFAGRGLSHIVQGLRAMEEERMDDDWDVMREIEEEQEAASFQIPESQPAQENSRPYKKKGQKRTTRKVNMRPVVPRPKPRPDPNASTIDEESASEDELTAVPETQLPAGVHGDSNLPDDSHGEDVASLHAMSDPDVDSQPELDADSDEDPEYNAKPALGRAKSFSERIKEAVSMAKPATKDPPAKDQSMKPPQAPDEEGKKPKPRKVNPQTHANYRSLKIGNRGSRGGGRFRRR